VEKYGKARQATDDNIIRRMRSACRIDMATGTHFEYVILTAFNGKNVYPKAPQRYFYTYIVSLVSGFVYCCYKYSTVYSGDFWP
jgi:hypothetical protein